MKGFPHYKLIEIPILAGQATLPQVPFPDQPDLRYARVLAIDTYTRTTLAASFPSSYPIITGLDISKISIVLETNDPDDVKWTDDKGKVHDPRTALGNGRFTNTQQNVKYMPLAMLNRVQNAGTSGIAPDPFVRQLMEFDNLYISYDKCFLAISGAGLGNTSTVAVVLGIYYTWLDINNRPISRN